VTDKGHSGAIVTIVERNTRFTVSSQVNDKLAVPVTAAKIALLMLYQAPVLTMTADNGKEFAFHEQMTDTLSAKVYFADPYCSWQRGLNENTYGLLRQYWPKATGFKKVSQKEVSSVIVK
jgi:IS30 family transposase